MVWSRTLHFTRSSNLRRFRSKKISSLVLWLSAARGISWVQTADTSVYSELLGNAGMCASVGNILNTRTMGGGFDNCAGKYTAGKRPQLLLPRRRQQEEVLRVRPRLRLPALQRRLTAVPAPVS
jgi:hypothetical protein